MQNDVRLINANALKVRMFRSKEFNFETGSFDLPVVPWRDIEDADTIDAVPVVHAHWVPASGKSHIWYCSACGDKINYKQNRRTYNIPKVPVEQKNRFCRNCGAKMDAKGE